MSVSAATGRAYTDIGRVTVGDCNRCFVCCLFAQPISVCARVFVHGLMAISAVARSAADR